MYLHIKSKYACIQFLRVFKHLHLHCRVHVCLNSAGRRGFCECLSLAKVYELTYDAILSGWYVHASVVLCEKNFRLLRNFLSVYHTLSRMLLRKQTESSLKLGGLSHWDDPKRDWQVYEVIHVLWWPRRAMSITHF